MHCQGMEMAKNWVGLPITSLLSGKALEAYTAMDEVKTHFYKDLNYRFASGFV